MIKKINLNKYLSAISEPNRLKILELLKNNELCACEIHPILKLPQNLNSHHLKILKDLDLLKSKKDGNKIIYSRNEEKIKLYQSKLNNIII